MTTPGLLKLADELENRYWSELFKVFEEKAEMLYRKHPIMPYIYDNYYDESSDQYSLELVMGTAPEDHNDNRGKPWISKEHLNNLIVSLGQAFRMEFPTAEFLLTDLKIPPGFPGEPHFVPVGFEEIMKQLKITINKDNVKVK